MGKPGAARRKAVFHVVYRLRTAADQDQWRDYFGRGYTYMAACEGCEALQAREGARYEFKVFHQRLLGKAA